MEAGRQASHRQGGEGKGSRRHWLVGWLMQFIWYLGCSLSITPCEPLFYITTSKKRTKQGILSQPAYPSHSHARHPSPLMDI